MNRIRLFLASIILLGCVCAASAREDSYDKLARELAEVSISTGIPKIAIIPFSYVDKRKSDAGIVISERLTTRMVKLKKCKVIERQLLENVMQELHLEATGVVDVETTKKLGKVLGVEALITGTLMDAADESAEINARTINAETAEVLATSSVEVKKTWTDGGPVAPAPVANTQQQPSYQQESEQPAYKAVSSGPARRPHGFFDVFIGAGNGTMDFAFANNGGLSETALRLDLNGNGVLESNVAVSKFEVRGAKTTQAFMPIGFRLVGFGEYLGGAFEMSYYAQNLAKQQTKAIYNNSGNQRDFNFGVDDYLRVDVITLLSGDLLVRLSKRMIQPYAGVGIGMTINMIQSPYISGYSGGVANRSFSDTAIGFLFRVPIGVRVVVDPRTSLFVEYRPTFNTFSHNRGGIAGDTDTVTMSTGFILLGAGFKF